MDIPLFDGIYRNKRVLVTGNTGFKGSWMTLWLSRLGAQVYGYSLAAPTTPSLFELVGLDSIANQQEADVLDLDKLTRVMREVRPDIIFHLAAQSLVRESYENPHETAQVNVIGSVNVLEAVRRTGIPAAVVMVTSDKCYLNKEWLHGYRENDPLGGYDPYSASKGAAEVLIDSWRNSFFHPQAIDKHGVRVASVRAGNVIGGGDWAKDRIVPDCIRDLASTGVIGVRNPDATRPWQHVLEPLHGYMQLGAHLLETNNDNIASYCEAFNFGPNVSSNRSVDDLVQRIIVHWGSGVVRTAKPRTTRHEASLLNLSFDKAYHKLGWLPRWDFDTTVRHTVEWYAEWNKGSKSLRDFTLSQISAYEDSEKKDTLQTQYL
jgi:CDP-glucose 4,6-dehydratase